MRACLSHSCSILQQRFSSVADKKRRISVIARATHKEEEISEKFHLDRVDNEPEIGVSITK
jgi:hypothetical protein